MNWSQVAVQGVISGATVILGVLAGAWVERTNTRRRSVELAFQALGNPLSWAMGGLIDPDADHSMGGNWYANFNRAFELLTEIQLQARGFRGSKVVAEEARKLGLLLAVANSMMIKGESMSIGVITLADTDRLRRAIYRQDEQRAESLRLAEYERISELLRSFPFPGGTP